MKIPSLISSLVAGSLLLGSAVGLADHGPPSPPKPPKAPKAHIQIDGLEDMINSQIDQALAGVSGDPRIPPAVRDTITARLKKVKAKIAAKAAGGAIDPEELGELGEEIGAEMEEFGREMEKWGDDFARDMQDKMQKQLGSGFKFAPGNDDDDDDDANGNDDDDDFGADDDLDDAVRDLGSLKLAPQQRDQIKKLRADSDAKVQAAKRELDRLSKQLEKQLANPAASDADISRSIDAVAAQEAAIRKARVLAWHTARRVLDDAQRTKVEASAKGKTK